MSARIGSAGVLLTVALHMSMTMIAGDAGAQSSPGLGGTSWQLVRVQYMDDTVVTPDDRSKYTFAFGADGMVSVRVDCNRGRGTWKSEGPNQVAFGALALTRAMCPPGSLHDRIVKDLEHVRSYILEDGHLFLSLMADGGIYELEPPPAPAASAAPAMAATAATVHAASSAPPDATAHPAAAGTPAISSPTLRLLLGSILGSLAVALAALYAIWHQAGGNW